MVSKRTQDHYHANVRILWVVFGWLMASPNRLWLLTRGEIVWVQPWYICGFKETKLQLGLAILVENPSDYLPQILLYLRPISLHLRAASPLIFCCYGYYIYWYFLVQLSLCLFSFWHLWGITIGLVWMTIIKNGNGYFIPSNEMPIICITSNPKLECLVSFNSIVIEIL